MQDLGPHPDLLGQNLHLTGPQSGAPCLVEVEELLLAQGGRPVATPQRYLTGNYCPHLASETRQEPPGGERRDWPGITQLWVSRDPSGHPTLFTHGSHLPAFH